MRARKSIAAAAVIGIVASAAAWIHMGAPHAAAASPDAVAAAAATSAPTATGAFGRRFRVGDSFVYAVEAARGVAVGGARKLDATLHATLALTLVGRSDDGFTVRAELRDPRFESAVPGTRDVSAALVQPFAFTLRPTGEIGSFAFPKGSPPEAVGLLKDLATSFQMVAPLDARASWQTTEEDASGEYTADYTRSETGVHRSKIAYQKAHGARGLAPLSGDYQVKSSVDFQLDATGWPKAINEDESLHIKAATMEVILARKTMAKLVAVDRRADLVASAGTANLEPAGVSEAEAFAKAKENAATNLVAGRKLAQIAGDLHAPSSGVRDDATTAMSALFRLDPESTKEAADTILHGHLDEESKARMSTALGTAGTAASQRALGSLLTSPDADSTTQVRAAAALGLSHNQVPENEELLTSAMSSPASDVRSSSALALGNSVRSANAEGSYDTSGGLETLIEGLEHATTKEDQILFLQALGNTGAPGALDAIAPYLSSADLELRATATFALRFIPGDSADQDIITATKDPEFSVRLQAVNTVRYRTIAPLRAAIDNLLRTDPSETVRLAIVSALNMKRADDPSVDTMIRWAEENDPSSKVRKLAKQVLAVG